MQSNNSLHIGNTVFPWWVGAAPLAGFSHRAYREYLRKWGAGFVVSEMISVEGLFRGDRKSWEMVDIEGEINPWLQLFGKHDTKKWYTVARRLLQQYPNILIDINFGCPVRKVVQTQAGSALLAFPQAMGDIVKAVKDAGASVTAKVRLGISSPLWEKFIPELEKAGVDAITIHGRYANQFYSETADWAQIAHIRKIYSGVLIGNGDITSPEIALSRKQQSGVDGIMIGRHALSAPFIFQQIAQYEATSSYTLPPPEEIKKMVLEYARLYLTTKKSSSLVPIRATILAMMKGFEGARHIRENLSHVTSYEDLATILKTS